MMNHERAFFRFSIFGGPLHSLWLFTLFPSCPSIGQYFPLRQREQLPFGGNSTTLRNLPYLRLGMLNPLARRSYNIAVNILTFS